MSKFFLGLGGFITLLLFVTGVTYEPDTIPSSLQDSSTDELLQSLERNELVDNSGQYIAAESEADVPTVTNRELQADSSLQATPQPARTEPVVVRPTLACDQNYTGGCVPVVSYDLDCGDISFSVRVVGVDVHRFDRDKDGKGCEANG